ncbi:Zinc finger protein 546-like, partial [Plakobranchus ocellatus]
MSRREVGRDSHFQGVTMGELKQLERVFRVNVDVFEFTNLDSESPELKPLQRSEYLYTNTMKILYYNEHFMYIIDIDKLGCALACEKCGKLWKQQCSLDRHEKSCTGLGSRVRYYGGVYTTPSSIVEDLSRYGFGIDENFIYPYRATFDFEVFFDSTDLPSGSRQTQYKARHVPLSVAVASNVEGFEEPVCFVSEGEPSTIVESMVDHLLKIADKASEILHTKFKSVLDQIREVQEEQEQFGEHENIPISSLSGRFEGYLNSLPVVGFNSGKYDINVIKPYLIRHLLHEDVDIIDEVRDKEGEEETENDGEGRACFQGGPFV